MIRVTVEIWRHGDPTDKEVLGEGVIVNDLTGTKTHGNYKYFLRSKGQKFREGEIKKFQRQRKNVWWLLFYVMKDAMWSQQGETPL